MTPPFALVIGEVLVDLIEGADDAGSILYRPRFGGSPLNVAVGVRRLGADVEFVGSFGADVFGRRMREFLLSEDVGVAGSMEAGMGTCLSVAISEAGHVAQSEIVAEYNHDVRRSLLIRRRCRARSLVCKCRHQ